MATNEDENIERQELPQPQEASSGQLFGIPTKWVLIGGGGGAALLVVIVVIVLVLSGAFSSGNPQPRSVLDLVPDDADSVLLFDWERILANDVISDKLDSDDELEELEDDLGIRPDDLSEMAVVEWDGGEVIVLRGSFDLEYIREELEDTDSEETTYRGYEVWEDLEGGAGALLDGYLIFSEYATRPVENVLKNLYNESGSLGQTDEDNEMKQILDKLGRGLVIYAGTGDSCRVERCEGYGWTLTEIDESFEESTIEIVLLFRNERAAERAADDYDEVADFLEQESDFDIEDTKADGVFVVGVATEELE